MNNFVYILDNTIYINLTNKCSNKCSFCIREQNDGIKDGNNMQTLWIERDPTADEVIEQLPENIDDYNEEVVFCGFGEPTYNLEALEEVAEYLHCINKTTRINTNGQANLIAEVDVSSLIADCCDVVNISLNAPTAKEYQKICHSIFGEKAFFEMLDFAKNCKRRGAKVVFSVVDVLPESDIELCKKLAKDTGVDFRLREKI